MNKTVLVLGGTGFVGEGIVSELINQGYTPVVLVRNPKKISADWKDKIKVILGDANQIDKLAYKISAYNPIACIYSIGLLKEEKGRTYIDFHYNWAKKALAVSESLNISNFIYISANGSKENGTEYQKTKWGFEQYLKDYSKIKYQIVKPSLVWDYSSKFSFTEVLRSLVRFRVVPLIDGGNFKFSPVLREDLSKAIVNLINSEDSNTYLVGGAKTYTFKELIQIVAAKFKKKVIFFTMPSWLIKLFLPFLEIIPNFPLSSNQLTMMKEENIVSDLSIWNKTLITPKSIE